MGVRGMFRSVPTPDPNGLGSRLDFLRRTRNTASEKREGAHSSPAQRLTLGSRGLSLIVTSRRQWVKPSLGSGPWVTARGVMSLEGTATFLAGRASTGVLPASLSYFGLLE